MIGVRGYSQLHNEFEASLGYTRRFVSKTWPVSGVHAKALDLSRSFDLPSLPSLLYLLGVKYLQNRTLLISVYSAYTVEELEWTLLQHIWHKYLSFSFYQHILNTYRIVFIVIPPHMHICILIILTYTTTSLCGPTPTDPLPLPNWLLFFVLVFLCGEPEFN